MKSKVKVMLLGMTIALIGIYLRCLFIGIYTVHSSNTFVFFSRLSVF